ncbi:aspartate aminotransferase family protein [Mesorhizobium sp. DCY119]|uniref:aspartate aminotransferase family protein n=1 Tax=Mesorhizobium sp. DCY119 TaxID=2108445 RepID=UPI000E727D76|nr:aspartate aminotransferase family protein [Mesorhizobium sp. DCY119]RJG41274.1 aspartate aminotransferase family protein [Mesorhizobium sp. DCY119]
MTYQNFSRAQLQAIDSAHHLHPFTDHKELRGTGARMITRAEGPFIYDSEGTQILDGMAGLWCVNIGYGREELANAAYDQMKELPFYNSFFRCTTPTPVMLAAKLAELAPANVNQVFYGSSGSEANDTALRLVRHYWALEGKPTKRVVISRKSAYHGSSIAGASLGGMDGMHSQLYGAVPDIVHVMPPYSFELALPGESDHDFGLRAAGAVEQAILDAGAENVAAFIGEPVLGAGGVKIPPASYWPEIQRICDKYDVLLMIDEVITGYGRTGAWFASETYGIKADTITTAKALTSGYQPLSALLVGDRIASTLVDKGGEFYHGYTYSGHPVACAVALKNLEIIEREGLIDRVKDDTGPYFATALAERIGTHDLIGETRAIGLMGAIEIVKDKGTRERFAGGASGDKVRDLSIANGFMVRSVGDTIIMAPPLIWTREHVDMACDRLAKALDSAEADLRRAG